MNEEFSFQNKIKKLLNENLNLESDQVERLRAARERYQKLSKLPPEQKKVVSKKWQEYQQVPEEQKQQLSASAKAAPTATNAAAAPTSTPAPATR